MFLWDVLQVLIYAFAAIFFCRVLQKKYFLKKIEKVTYCQKDSVVPSSSHTWFGH